MGSPQNNSRKAPINPVPNGHRDGGMVPHGPVESSRDKNVNVKSNTPTENLSRLNQKRNG